MTLLSWTNEYAIGDDLIDGEHQELFRLVNAFHDLWVERHDRRTIAPLLNQLIAYAEMHFQHEEAVMRNAGFPKLAEHQQTHVAMVESIFALRLAFEQASTHLEMDTLKFVKSWLLDHIIRSDYLFRDFLARQKSSADAAQP